MRPFNIALTAAALLLAACTTTEPRIGTQGVASAANAPRINGHFVEYDGWNAVCGEGCTCESTDFPAIAYRCLGRHPNYRDLSMMVEFARRSFGPFDLRHMAEADVINAMSTLSCPPGRSGDPEIAPEGISLTGGRDSAGPWEDLSYAVASYRVIGCDRGEDGAAATYTTMVTLPHRDTGVILGLLGMDDYSQEDLLRDDLAVLFWELVGDLEYYGDTVAAR